MDELARVSRFAQRLGKADALSLLGPVISAKKPGADIVLAPPLGDGAWPDSPLAGNPFVRYRRQLWSYEVARHYGWNDDRFVGLVEDLDEAVVRVGGTGFRITPLVSATTLAEAVGLNGLLIKDETHNVSGSHKARHLFGIALHLKILETQGELNTTDLELVIASCGNAALAAAVVARALKFTLRVFVPPSAPADVLDQLSVLGATVVVCERRAGEAGDPSYLRFLEAVAVGGVPFCCQGPDNGLTLDGGRTIGFELADQLAPYGAERIFVQVGGGALATGVADGLAAGHSAGILMREPRLHPVQTEGAYPLAKAYRSVLGDVETTEVADRLMSDQTTSQQLISEAAEARAEHMVPWPNEPQSAAHGILDDETYDWQSVLRSTVATGGWPVVALESEILEANDLARLSGIDADHTGTAGLAGLLHLLKRRVISPEERVVLLFTGIRR